MIRCRRNLLFRVILITVDTLDFMALQRMEKNVKLVVRMRGGLGNQLFILGFALALAKESELPIKIICDKREYEYYKVRNYEIDEMNVSSMLGDFYDESLKKSLWFDFLMKVFHLRIFLRNRFKIKKESENTYIEYVLKFVYKTAPIYLDRFKSDEIYMYGYFVDAAPLLRIRSELQQCFSLRDVTSIEEYTKEIQEAGHTVALSMRLGQDYVEARWPICSIDFYSKALEYIRREDTKVFVFSNEIESAMEILKGYDCIFVKDCSAVEQLEIMSRCDDFIISNSTFSWWGAFLGYKEERVICSPEYWHTGPTKESKLYYSNMHIIN